MLCMYRTWLILCPPKTSSRCWRFFWRTSSLSRGNFARKSGNILLIGVHRASPASSLACYDPSGSSTAAPGPRFLPQTPGNRHSDATKYCRGALQPCLLQRPPSWPRGLVFDLKLWEIVARMHIHTDGQADIYSCDHQGKMFASTQYHCSGKKTEEMHSSRLWPPFLLLSFLEL